MARGVAGAASTPATQVVAVEVRAAGGVVVRPGPDGSAEVALIHRPAYDDWSFPKGKLHDGESDHDAALREVEEETGLRCETTRSLGSVRYRDRYDRLKSVQYFLMRAVSGEGKFRAGNEVDVLRWVLPSEAERLLSYARDRDVLATAMAP